jgi:hypothetical protein
MPQGSQKSDRLPSSARGGSPGVHGVRLVPEGHGGLTVATERLSAIAGAVPRRPATSFAPALRTHRGWPSGHRARRPRALAPRQDAFLFARA